MTKDPSPTEYDDVLLAGGKVVRVLRHKARTGWILPFDDVWRGDTLVGELPAR